MGVRPPVDPAGGYLLDTHVLAWLTSAPERVSDAARDLLADPLHPVYVSSISAFEVANKVRLGKWPEMDLLAATWSRSVAAMGLLDLPVDAADAQLAGALAWNHRDPFDRIIGVQALRRRLTLVSADTVFDTLDGLRLLRP